MNDINEGIGINEDIKGIEGIHEDMERKMNNHETVRNAIRTIYQSGLTKAERIKEIYHLINDKSLE